MASRIVTGKPITVSSPRREYTFHLLGLVHLPVSERFMGCAFTQKIVKMSKMLLSLGHRVILYGCETSDAPCTEFVETHKLADIRREWGNGDNRPECDGLGYRWRETGFRHDFNTTKTKTTKKYYQKCIDEINKRKNPDHFLLVMQGVYQRPISKETGLFLTVEPGIGYRGSFARFRAYESAYLMNFTLGSQNPGQSINGDWYHRVIPNYFDEKDFTYIKDAKRDYYLFVGRIIQRKGLDVARKTIEAIGGKLIIAGQGKPWFNSPNCEFVGYIDTKQRNELMSGAIATFVPTLYLEAFGGVNVESQLCGTPVITTDFGCFPETVINGVTGYRCHMLRDFIKAAQDIKELDNDIIRQCAERYLMKNVRWEFQKWFDDLFQLYLSTTDDNIKGWHFYE
jgi:glycosyltransferase involved in cell wall biosynthesis